MTEREAAAADAPAPLRPVAPGTHEPLGPFEQPGYYPGYSTLAQQNYWDAATRALVLDRVQNVPPIRFFSEDEALLMEAICERVLPQDDRVPERRIPIVPQIDKQLYEDLGEGYRFVDMPDDRAAFRKGIVGIEQTALELHGRGFLELSVAEREALLRSLHDGKPQAGRGVWDELPAHRFFMLLVQHCAEAYYAHPWAWDEIGFGGPAYPRAYVRLERGSPEHWEVHEKRYAWEAPPGSLSDRYEAVGGDWEHLASPGRGGTH